MPLQLGSRHSMQLSSCGIGSSGHSWACEKDRSPGKVISWLKTGWSRDRHLERLSIWTVSEPCLIHSLADGGSPDSWGLFIKNASAMLRLSLEGTASLVWESWSRRRGRQHVVCCCCCCFSVLFCFLIFYLCISLRASGCVTMDTSMVSFGHSVPDKLFLKGWFS